MEGERISSQGHKERLCEGNDFGAGLYGIGRISAGRNWQWEGIPGRENSISKGINMGIHKHVHQIVSSLEYRYRKGRMQRDLYVTRNFIFSKASWCRVGYYHHVTDEETETSNS